jgi:cell division protein FtsB
MDAKYLAEIRARLDAGRIPMKSDMEALLAEVERMTAEIATLKKEIEQLAEERDAAKRKKDELEAFYEQLCRNIAQEASK